MKSLIMDNDADSLLNDIKSDYECKITDSLDQENKLIIRNKLLGRIFEKDFYISLSFNIKKFKTIKTGGTPSSKYILLGQYIFEGNNAYKDVDPKRLVREVLNKPGDLLNDTRSLRNDMGFITDFALGEKCEFDNLESALEEVKFWLDCSLGCLIEYFRTIKKEIDAMN